MKIMDVIFIGMLFLMTISIVNKGHVVLVNKLEEMESLCRRK